MNFIDFLKPSVIGVDIQSSLLRLVQCKQLKQCYLLEKIMTVQLPEGVVADGKIVDWPTLGVVLKRVLGQELKRVRLVLCLPFHLVRIQELRLPLGLNATEIEAEINLVMRRDLPGVRNALAIDYSIVKHPETGYMEVLFAAAKEEDIHKLIESCLAANLKLAVIDVDAYALKRAITFSLPQLAWTSEIKAILYFADQRLVSLLFNEKGVISHQQIWERKADLSTELHKVQNYLCNRFQLNPEQFMICSSATFEEKLTDIKVKIYPINPFKTMQKSLEVENNLSAIDDFLLAAGLTMRKMKLC